MMRCLLPMLLVAVLPGPALCQSEKKNDRVDRAVDRALKFLSHLQEKDGAFRTGREEHPAITSLAVMAFLSAGHVPGEGPYGDVVERGIRRIVSVQDGDGMFSSGAYTDMYNQGICTLMLAEAAGMTDARLSKELRPKLAAAVKVLLKAQRLGGSVHKGGWRYTVSGDDADLSVTGWQLLALRAARNLGADVPKERIDLAIDYVLRCRDAGSGGFYYQPGGGRLTLACTGTGLLALELSGKVRHKSTEALKAGSYILKNPPTWDGEHFHYAMYYCSQGMFQLGQNYWEAFRPHMHKTLLAHQEANGSWLGAESSFSAAYTTSMAILALTVENRYLPIYQRHEGPTDRD